MGSEIPVEWNLTPRSCLQPPRGAAECWVLTPRCWGPGAKPGPLWALTLLPAGWDLLGGGASRRTSVKAAGSRPRTEAIVPSDLEPWRVGLPAASTQPSEHAAPRPPAHVAGSAGARAAVPRPHGPGVTYPLGASSQLKGLLLTVVFTVFQLLQDLVQHHRPLFLRGLCGSPDGKRGEKNSREGWRQEERDGGEGGREGEGQAERGGGGRMETQEQEDGMR